MSILEDGSRNIIQLCKLLEPIINLGPELERIGGIANHEQNLKVSIGKLQKSYSELQEKIESQNQKFLEDKKNNEDVLNVTNYKVNHLKKSADDYYEARQKEANELVKQIASERKQIIDVAKLEAKNIVSSVDSKIVEQRRQIQENNNTLAAIEKDIEIRNGVLASIDEAISNIRTRPIMVS